MFKTQWDWQAILFAIPLNATPILPDAVVCTLGVCSPTYKMGSRAIGRRGLIGERANGEICKVVNVGRLMQMLDQRIV